MIDPNDITFASEQIPKGQPYEGCFKITGTYRWNGVQIVSQAVARYQPEAIEQVKEAIRADFRIEAYGDLFYELRKLKAISLNAASPENRWVVGQAFEAILDKTRRIGQKPENQPCDDGASCGESPA